MAGFYKKRQIITPETPFKVGEIYNYGTVCPSQWFAITKCGRMIYVRYRCGRLTLTVGEPNILEEANAVCGDLIYEKYVGDEMDGYMTFNELKNHCFGVVVWPEKESV